MKKKKKLFKVPHIIQIKFLYKLETGTIKNELEPLYRFFFISHVFEKKSRKKKKYFYLE